MTLLAFFVAILVLVGFHEFGHYLVAKFCGVDVLRFSIGFGKPLWISKPKTSTSTQWAIGAIPLGGYVKLLDHRDPGQQIEEGRACRAFDRQVLWKRSAIVAAGPIANFLLAFVLFTVIYMAGVKQLSSILDEPPVNSLAYTQGIRQGDRVIGLFNVDEPSDIEPIQSWNRLRWKLLKRVMQGDAFGLEVRAKDGGNFRAVFSEEQIKKMTAQNDIYSALGVRPSAKDPAQFFELKVDLFEASYLAFDRVWDITSISLYSVRDLIAGKASLKQLSGPLSIAELAGKSAEVGFQSFMAFLALISISLGILNLLPFPMLDGGQLVYDLLEAVSGKRISINVQIWLQKVGLLGIISLTLIAFFNDLLRIFTR